jgi:uncharacterized protein YnzC (UPF0291/DUF896 family)
MRKQDSKYIKNEFKEGIKALVIIMMGTDISPRKIFQHSNKI